MESHNQSHLIEISLGKSKNEVAMFAETNPTEVIDYKKSPDDHILDE